MSDVILTRAITTEGTPGSPLAGVLLTPAITLQRYPTTHTGFSVSGHAIGVGARDPLRDYSGVVIDQNQTGASPSFLGSDATIYQTFTLPADYTRAGQIPPLTGIQLLVGVDSGCASAAAIDWHIERETSTGSWVALATGSTIGTAREGNEVWFNIFFNEALSIDPDWLTRRFRFYVQSRSGVGPIHEPVEYDGTSIIVNNQRIEVVPDIAPLGLEEGVNYPFSLNGVPSFLSLAPGGEEVLYSVQQGINRIWYATPNPLSGDQATSTALGQDASLIFRVLAAVADQGIDFLGNVYRSLAITSSGTLTESNSDFWLSAPQPSKFAVVNRYFDVTKGEQQDPAVIDRVYIEPITPGVFFHIYYSNDSPPGGTPESWDNLLWTPVTRTYQALTAETFALPTPITAKYIKIEFSHLQAKSYSPGNFQKPVLYKKFPKWVLDYFLLRVIDQTTEDPMIGETVSMTFDALDFAYNYYRDDLTSEPDGPHPLSKELRVLQQEDAQTRVDPETVSKIRVAFQPFLNEPNFMARTDYLLGHYLLSSATNNQDYPIETIDAERAFIEEVSSLQREPVLLEKSYPVMFFFVQARHAYRVAAAYFDRDKAYFAGINRITFLRERYNVPADTPVILESTGDTLNAERNDFVSSNFSWRVYETS